MVEVWFEPPPLTRPILSQAELGSKGSGIFCYPSRAKGVQKFYVGIGRDVTCLYVISFSSHTSEARGLKIGMHNPCMDGSKVTSRFLIFSL